MNEKTQEETKEEEKEGTDGDTKEGDKPEEFREIDRANKAAERLESANKRFEELLVRQEKIAVNKALGGKSEAGGEAAKAEEETPQQYKDRVMRGEA